MEEIILIILCLEVKSYFEMGEESLNPIDKYSDHNPPG